MAQWSIGIDFGHGETSVAALNLAQLQVQTDVAVLELDNQKTQVTAIGRNAAGDVLIGQAALTTDDAHQTRIGFKADPSEASPETLALMRLYFHTLCAQHSTAARPLGRPGAGLCRDAVRLAGRPDEGRLSRSARQQYRAAGTIGARIAGRTASCPRNGAGHGRRTGRHVGRDRPGVADHRHHADDRAGGDAGGIRGRVGRVAHRKGAARPAGRG